MWENGLTGLQIVSKVGEWMQVGKCDNVGRINGLVSFQIPGI